MFIQKKSDIFKQKTDFYTPERKISMLIDTHCHINCMLRGYQTKSAYLPLTNQELEKAQSIIQQAYAADTSIIFNVGTDLIESLTCIELAKVYQNCYAIVGIHPNDTTEEWKSDLKKLSDYVKNHAEYKIIGIGECGIDMHYQGYNLSRQQDCFKAQIELALEHNLALSIHSRDAAEETCKIIDQYAKEDNFRGIMHCFSYDESYANQVIDYKLVLGIGGTITYPKNQYLRTIVQNVDLTNIVLETDAPFLSPQAVRGKENCPAHIQIIARFIADVRQTSYEVIAQQTTQNVKKLFRLPNTVA